MPTAVGADPTPGTRWGDRRRWWSASVLPLLLLLAGATAVLALGRADFTTHPTVELYTTEGIMPGVLVQQVNARCSGPIAQPARSWFVSDSGEMFFFNASTPTYPDAEVLCSEARTDRWRQILVLGLSAAVLAAGVSAVQLVTRRRRDWEPRPGASRPKRRGDPLRAGRVSVVDDEVHRSVPTALIIVGLVVAGVLLGGIALALGGDRVVDCDSVSGLDALRGDTVNHVDGPDGGGGCIVPTTAAWTAAIVVALAPLIIGLLVLRNTRRA